MQTKSQIRPIQDGERVKQGEKGTFKNPKDGRERRTNLLSCSGAEAGDETGDETGDGDERQRAGEGRLANRRETVVLSDKRQIFTLFFQFSI